MRISYVLSHISCVQSSFISLWRQNAFREQYLQNIRKLIVEASNMNSKPKIDIELSDSKVSSQLVSPQISE